MLEIIINDESLDLYPDENIEINIKQSDVRDFAVNFNSFTHEFLIPASPKNNKILKQYWNFNALDQHQTNIDIPTKLLINKILFKNGSIKIIKASVRQNITENYTISFSTNLTSMKDVLSGWKLRDLEANIPFSSFPYNDQFIYPRFPSSNTFLEFPLISTSYLTNDYLYDNIASDGIKKEMIRPALRVKELINSFPNEYRINSGSFIDSDMYSKLYIYLNASEDLYANDIRPIELEQGSLSSGRKTTWDDWAPVPYFDSAIFFNFNDNLVVIAKDNYVKDRSFITTNITGNYIIHSQRVILNNDLTINEERTRRQENEGMRSSGRKSGTSTLFHDGKKLNGVKYGYRYFIQPLGTIAINSISIDVQWSGYEAGYSWVVTYRTVNSHNYPSPIILSPVFDIFSNLPDMTCYDFIISIVKMFNLIITFNDDNTLRLDYYTTFFSKEAIDLTNYMDNSQEISTPVIPNNLSFKHKENAFYVNQIWKDNQSDARAFGDVSLNGLTSNSTETQEVISKFSPVLFFDWEGNSDIKVATTENESQTAIWNVPILLVNNGITTTDGDKLAYKNDDNTAYPIVEWKNFDMKTNDLNPKSIVFSNDITEADGLYNTYYKELTERLYSPYNRYVEVEASLPRHLYNMSLGNIIIFKNNKYTIDEMKLNLITGRAKFKLNNIRDFVNIDSVSVKQIRMLKYLIKVPLGHQSVKITITYEFNEIENYVNVNSNGEILLDIPNIFENFMIEDVETNGQVFRIKYNFND